ncbi:hypothetical protein [Poriferisphaera sp. WC338]|uniref:hypothetical protein n=1 Tax=Poriferisphaera sp. WC338 TaxID=3425129 RepID=UPI003D8169FF
MISRVCCCVVTAGLGVVLSGSAMAATTLSSYAEKSVDALSETYVDHFFPRAINDGEVYVDGLVYFELNSGISTSDFNQATFIFTAYNAIDFGGVETDGPSASLLSAGSGRDINLSLAAYVKPFYTPSASDAKLAYTVEAGASVSSVLDGLGSPLQEVQEVEYDVTDWLKNAIDNDDAEYIYFQMVNNTFNTGVNVSVASPLTSGGGSTLPQAPYRLVLGGGVPTIPSPSAFGFGCLMLAGMVARRRRG